MKSALKTCGKNYISLNFTLHTLSNSTEHSTQGAINGNVVKNFTQFMETQRLTLCS